MKPAKVRATGPVAAAPGAGPKIVPGGSPMRLRGNQAVVRAAFDAAGLTLDRCAAIVAGIAGDAKASATDRLRAVDMTIRLTVGYAPTRSATITATVTPDQFFDASFEGKPPAITLEADSEPRG